MEGIELYRHELDSKKKREKGRRGEVHMERLWKRISAEKGTVEEEKTLNTLPTCY